MDFEDEKRLMNVCNETKEKSSLSFMCMYTRVDQMPKVQKFLAPRPESKKLGLKNNFKPFFGINFILTSTCQSGLKFVWGEN